MKHLRMKSKVLFIINGDKMQNNSKYEADQNKKLYLDPYPLLKADESFQLLLKQYMHVFAMTV